MLYLEPAIAAAPTFALSNWTVTAFTDLPLFPRFKLTNYRLKLRALATRPPSPCPLQHLLSLRTAGCTE